MDTICALATPPGRSALALIRISGPRALQVLAELAGSAVEPKAPKLLRLKGRDGEPIDEALVTSFKAPHSYTGEDVVEISCHGNPVIVEHLLAEIVSRETRLANPGEFTRRALANEKINLHQVESLDWVLNSETSGGVIRGLKAKWADLGLVVEGLRGEIEEILLAFQSGIDFGEGETGEVDQGAIEALAQSAHKRVSGWLSSYEQARFLVSEYRVVIAGPANVGKSSLFNLLSGQSRSIVFDRPGTTRDVVDVRLTRHGRVCRLFDTAGLRLSDDPIEGLGIEQTRQALARADLILWATDAPSLVEAERHLSGFSAPRLLVHTKADQSGGEFEGFVSVSTTSPESVEALWGRILPPLVEDSSEDHLILVSDREAALVRAALRSLEAGLDSLSGGDPMDLSAEYFIKAARELEILVGSVQPEDLLGKIFARFCIGK